ncbi:MAG: hypothetical protein RLY97_2322 [Pseudomonadota bacterium]
MKKTYFMAALGILAFATPLIAKPVKAVAKPAVKPAAAAPVAAAAPANGVNPFSVTIEFKVDKLVVEKGVSQHVLVSSSKVLPGDHVIVYAHIANAGSVAGENFAASYPVSSSMLLEDYDGVKYLVSVDGGKSFGKLEKLMLADAAGVKRPAQIGDVNAVQWLVPLVPAGGKITVQCKALIR